MTKTKFNCITACAGSGTPPDDGTVQRASLYAMNGSNLLKLAVGIGLLALAGTRLWQWARTRSDGSEKTFFYDLSEKKLFVGPRDAVPPIRGVNDAQTDAVRAVVISTNGEPANKRSWKIAYLEMYSPELKQEIEAARAAGVSPAMGRAEAQRHRFVRRLGDSGWYPMDSPQGEQIVTEWASPGPDGITPVVCSP